METVSGMMSLIAWILFAAVFIQQLQPASSGSINVDVVFMMLEDIQLEKKILDQVKKVLGGDLSSVFDIGNDKTRLALVACRKVSRGISEGCDWHVFTGLTGSKSVFDEALKKIQADGPNYQLTPGLTLIKEQVLTGGAKTRQQPIVIILDSCLDECQTWDTDDDINTAWATSLHTAHRASNPLDCCI